LTTKRTPHDAFVQYTKNFDTLGPIPWDWGRAWPPKTRSSPFVLPRRIWSF